MEAKACIVAKFSSRFGTMMFANLRNLAYYTCKISLNELYYVQISIGRRNTL